MGREVRRVPENWKHPKKENGEYIPLLLDFIAASERCDPKHPDYDPHGDDPLPENYMPVWTPEEKTHFQMYETTSEGSPISPVVKTPEELARWLADHKASAFGHESATYEQWLSTIKRGWAPSAVIVNGKLTSGVEAGR